MARCNPAPTTPARWCRKYWSRTTDTRWCGRASRSMSRSRWTSPRRGYECGQTLLGHDPEKWVPVFRKRSCSNKKIERDGDSTKSHLALGVEPQQVVLGQTESANWCF